VVRYEIAAAKTLVRREVQRVNEDAAVVVTPLGFGHDGALVRRA
jgi:hypothetical protein